MVQVSVPEFAGQESEDVHEWIDRFEVSTLSVPDERKSKLLSLAFRGSARAWFCLELKPTLREKLWPDIKKSILKRFSTQAPADKYLEKLSKLKYDPQNNSTLQSFFDEYIYTYQQAYKSDSSGEDEAVREQDLVRSLMLAIPVDVKRQLNFMTNLSEIVSLEELKSTIKRFDSNVRLEPSPKSDPIDAGKFKEIMTDVVKGMVNQQTKTLAALADQTAIIAGFARQGPRQQGRAYTKSYHASSKRLRFASPVEPRQSATSQALDKTQSDSKQQDQAMRFRDDRPPPYPCQYCNGDHWHSRCLERVLNQKGY